MDEANSAGGLTSGTGLGSCSLELPDSTSDEVAITAVLHAEGAYLVQQDIIALMQLWGANARIIDAKHTPTDATDDHTWQGREAIRVRYLHRVFPGHPARAEPADLAISITGQQAVVTATTSIGDEVSPAGDRWLLVKQDECWVLQELIFNLEGPTTGQNLR